jgi:NADH dehydrogenase [ubiquinone] 1 alpha subcomplex assembly factor 5
MSTPSLSNFISRTAASRQRACTAALKRNYAVQAPGKPSLEVFNRQTKHLQKDRAARSVEQSRKVDYLKDEVAMRLCERLLVNFTNYFHELESSRI